MRKEEEKYKEDAAFHTPYTLLRAGSADLGFAPKPRSRKSNLLTHIFLPKSWMILLAGALTFQGASRWNLYSSELSQLHNTDMLHFF